MSKSEPPTCPHCGGDGVGKTGAYTQDTASCYNDCPVLTFEINNE